MHITDRDDLELLIDGLKLVLAEGRYDENDWSMRGCDVP